MIYVGFFFFAKSKRPQSNTTHETSTATGFVYWKSVTWEKDQLYGISAIFKILDLNVKIDQSETSTQVV